MNRVELISKIAKETGFTKKDTEKFVRTFTDMITETLIGGGKVSISGFGTFETRARAQKEAYNPVTKLKITVAAKKVPAFKPAKGMKELVSAGNKNK